jgi:hypothetical protein
MIFTRPEGSSPFLKKPEISLLPEVVEFTSVFV